MKKLLPFITVLMLCVLTVKAQESEQFNRPLNSTFPRLAGVDVSKSSLAAPSTILDAYNAGQIFMKLIGNEDFNKVMLLMMNQTDGDLDLFLPDGSTQWRNPCTADTYYRFYAPERIDIQLGQSDDFLLVNQAGTTLINSGSCLFTDVSCSYNAFSTYFVGTYFEPVLDDTLQKLLPFNPDTSTLQQVHGDSDGYLLVQRNYNTSGMTSRYVYLDNANEGEIYTELTDKWADEALESLTTHDFIVELENDSKILKSLEIPTIKITNTGLQGASNTIFTIVIDRDIIAPELSILSDSLYQPELIDVSSTEDGIIYLVPENTQQDLTDIRGVCLDSIAAVANSAADISLSGLDNGIYWLYGRDEAGNISEPMAFGIFGVGIENMLSGQIRIYPNPANQLIFVETKETGSYSIEISSMKGQIIHNSNFEGNSYQIDLSAFQKGVYLITVKSDDIVTTRKIIRQ